MITPLEKGILQNSTFCNFFYPVFRILFSRSRSGFMLSKNRAKKCFLSRFSQKYFTLKIKTFLMHVQWSQRYNNSKVSKSLEKIRNAIKLEPSTKNYEKHARYYGFCFSVQTRNFCRLSIFVNCTELLKTISLISFFF